MAWNQVVKYFTVDLASSTTLSSGIDLQQGWSEVSLKIPSFSSGADIYLHGAIVSNGTFVRITQPVPNTSSVQLNDFRISSGTSGRIIPIPSNYQHLKIEISTAQTDATSTFQVICKS